MKKPTKKQLDILKKYGCNGEHVKDRAIANEIIKDLEEGLRSSLWKHRYIMGDKKKN